MNRMLFVISGLMLLGGCAVTQKPVYCAKVITANSPTQQQDYYPLWIVAINNQAVPLQTEHILPSGSYQLRVVELIHDPKLTLPAQSRYYIDWEIDLEPDTQYYVASQFFEDVDERYWQPVVTKKDIQSCVVP